MKPPRTVETGDVIAGYRIESVLGRGGMGVVYLATHTRLRRKAALKLLFPEHAEDPEFEARFIRESETAAALEHPNIVPIYDADDVDGVLFIAMRYIDGTDLRTQLKEHGPLTLERTLEVTRQIAGALDVAHEAGLIHRDVKPANILLERRSGRAYLTDFGIAKSASATGLTRTGSFVGTVDYCPPEQIEGRHVDGRADIYALGGVVFHCLTGHAPYVRTTDIAVMQAHLVDPPPALSTVRPDLPLALDGAIVTAMAKHREVRYGTATEFANALAEAASGTRGTEPVLVRGGYAETVADGEGLPTEATATSKSSKKHDRRGLWVGLGIGAAVLAAAGAATAIVLGRGGESAPRQSTRVAEKHPTVSTRSSVTKTTTVVQTRFATPIPLTLNPVEPHATPEGGRCFGPYTDVASLTLNGSVYRSDFIQCGGGGDHGGNAADVDALITFPARRLPRGTRSMRFTSLLGIDQDSSSSQDGSVVRWQVMYAGRTFCVRSLAGRGSSTTVSCRIPITEGRGNLALLKIREHATLVGDGRFFAGLVGPKVIASGVRVS